MLSCIERQLVAHGQWTSAFDYKQCISSRNFGPSMGACKELSLRTYLEDLDCCL